MVCCPGGCIHRKIIIFFSLVTFAELSITALLFFNTYCCNDATAISTFDFNATLSCIVCASSSNGIVSKRRTVTFGACLTPVAYINK